MAERVRGANWTDRARCCVQVALTLLAAAAVSLIVHELGHAAAIRLTGGRVARIDLALMPWPSGRTYALYPFVEAARQPTVTWLGGALANLATGAFFLVLWLPRRSRGLVVLSALVVANLGNTFASLVGYGVTGAGQMFIDYQVGASGLGLSATAGRWLAVALGLPGTAAVGFWFLGATLEWSSTRAPSSTPAERLGSLLWCAWVPTVGIGGFWVTASARSAWSWKWPVQILVFASASLAACWLVAMASAGRRMPRARPERRPGRWGPVLAAALLAGLGLIAVRAADTWLDPERPTPERIAAWVSRSPRSEHRLRLAAFWSAQLGRLDDGLRYAKRAAAVAPRSAGALFDLAALLHAQGRHREALEFLEAAASLRPDLATLAAKTAQVQEALGLDDDAARSWRLYAEMEQAAEPIAEVRDRHVGLALDRARRLEEKVVPP